MAVLELDSLCLYDKVRLGSGLSGGLVALAAMTFSHRMSVVPDGLLFQVRERAIRYSEDIDKHRQAHAVLYGRMLVIVVVTRRVLRV